MVASFLPVTSVFGSHPTLHLPLSFSSPPSPLILSISPSPFPLALSSPPSSLPLAVSIFTSLLLFLPWPWSPQVFQDWSVGRIQLTGSHWGSSCALLTAVSSCKHESCRSSFTITWLKNWQKCISIFLVASSISWMSSSWKRDRRSSHLFSFNIWFILETPWSQSKVHTVQTESTAEDHVSKGFQQCFGGQSQGMFWIYQPHHKVTTSQQADRVNKKRHFWPDQLTFWQPLVSFPTPVTVSLNSQGTGHS